MLPFAFHSVGRVVHVPPEGRLDLGSVLLDLQQQDVREQYIACTVRQYIASTNPALFERQSPPVSIQVNRLASHESAGVGSTPSSCVDLQHL